MDRTMPSITHPNLIEIRFTRIKGIHPKDIAAAAIVCGINGAQNEQQIAFFTLVYGRLGLSPEGASQKANLLINYFQAVEAHHKNEGGGLEYLADGGDPSKLLKVLAGTTFEQYVRAFIVESEESELRSGELEQMLEEAAGRAVDTHLLRIEETGDPVTPEELARALEETGLGKKHAWRAALNAQAAAERARVERIPLMPFAPGKIMMPGARKRIGWSDLAALAVEQGIPTDQLRGFITAVYKSFLAARGIDATEKSVQGRVSGFLYIGLKRTGSLEALAKGGDPSYLQQHLTAFVAQTPATPATHPVLSGQAPAPPLARAQPQLEERIAAPGEGKVTEEPNERLLAKEGLDLLERLHAPRKYFELALTTGVVPAVQAYLKAVDEKGQQLRAYVAKVTKS